VVSIDVFFGDFGAYWLMGFFRFVGLDTLCIGFFCDGGGIMKHGVIQIEDIRRQIHALI